MANKRKDAEARLRSFQMRYPKSSWKIREQNGEFEVVALIENVEVLDHQVAAIESIFTDPKTKQ